MQTEVGISDKKKFLEGGDIFSLENIGIRFENKYALKNISLKVSKGEILFITGVSGAGKTTLLRVLAGEIKSSEGKFKFNDRDQFITRVFQDLRLLQDQTLEENLWLSFDNFIYESKREFKKEMQNYCRFFSIHEMLNLKVSEANGGLKQQVALIRALLSRPQVLLLDEPTSSLDTEKALKVYEILDFVNSKYRTTCIWATHNRELIKKFNGRIIYLDKGKLIYSGHACFI
ncbi:ATP-binding cassette domain-containing protein [Bacteriovoracales bacterium]|nr:ATP-binding cassette domain-containing protein [Bacteriovoracales bacterium]